MLRLTFARQPTEHALIGFKAGNRQPKSSPEAAGIAANPEKGLENSAVGGVLAADSTASPATGSPGVETIPADISATVSQGNGVGGELNPAAENAELRPQRQFSIDWRGGSSNFWGGRNGQRPVAIVDHIMQGTLEASDSWFRNRRSEVSAHYGIGRDGRIWQWVRVEDAAWANGWMESPDLSLVWLAECLNQQINPNLRTISVEHEGDSGVPFTDTQYYASLWLHRYLCATYDIPANRQHIVGHYQITSGNRANCPGKAFPWDRLMTDLAKIFRAEPLPSEIPLRQYTPWVEDVPGLVLAALPPHVVMTPNAIRRRRPSLSTADNSVMNLVPQGKVLSLAGYTDQGPAYRDVTRWFLIAASDGGGWMHATSLIDLSKQPQRPARPGVLREVEV